MERMSAITERDMLTDCGRDDPDVSREPVPSHSDLLKRMELILLPFVAFAFAFAFVRKRPVPHERVMVLIFFDVT